MKDLDRPTVEALIASAPPPDHGERITYREKTVVVVMASWNEAGKVGRGVSKVPRDVVDTVVVVDNGSGDTTAREANDAGAIVISHPHNLGAGGGYRTGFWFAKSHEFDLVVELAGDDQDDPSEIPRVIDHLLDNDLDYVQGSRWMEGGRTIGMTRSRSFLTKLYSFLFRRFYGHRITDATNGFRVFRTELLDNDEIDLWQRWLIGYELEPYLLIKTVQLGYRVGEAPVTKLYHGEMRANTKMVPITSWYSILRPLFLLRLGLRH